MLDKLIAALYCDNESLAMHAKLAVRSILADVKIVNLRESQVEDLCAVFRKFDSEYTMTACGAVDTRQKHSDFHQ